MFFIMMTNLFVCNNNVIILSQKNNIALWEIIDGEQGVLMFEWNFDIENLQSSNEDFQE